MKKNAVIFLLSVVSLFQVHPEVSFVVADVTADKAFLDTLDGRYYTDLLYGSLYSLISGKEYTYLLARSIGTGGAADWRIANEIDAYAVINEIDLNYLVYGFIKTTAGKDATFEADFKIYSRKDDKVVKEVAYGSPDGNRETFIKESAFKINIAVYQLVKSDGADISGKITEDIANYNRDKEFKDKLKDFRLDEYLGFAFSAGYAVPFGSWGDLFTGILDLEAGIRIVRLPLLYDGGLLKISARPGFSLSYTLGKNQPNIVEEYLHSFVFRFPVEFLFAIQDRFIVNANADLHVRLDLVYQNLYGTGQNQYATAAFGWSTGLGFEYALDNDGVFTVGLNNKFDFGAYNVFYYDYKIQSYLVIRFKETTREPDRVDVNDIKIKL